MPGTEVSRAIGCATKPAAGKEGAFNLHLGCPPGKGRAARPARGGRHGPVELRLAAIRVLGDRADPYSKTLLGILADSEPSLAQAAEASLIKLRGNVIMDSTIAAELARGNPKTRVALLRIVAQRRIVAALPDVLKAADDPQVEVRHAAIHALGRIIPPTDLSPLTTRLLAAKDPEEIKTIDAALDVACSRVVDRDLRRETGRRHDASDAGGQVPLARRDPAGRRPGGGEDRCRSGPKRQ